MTLILAIVFTGLAFIAMLYAYSNIRQGGARVYTLEREAILRRAIAAMFSGTGLLILTIALLIYDGQQTAAVAEPAQLQLEGSPQTGNSESVPLATTPGAPAADGSSQLPALETVTPTPTLDPLVPTATPTPIVIRGFVTGTGGNGLYMRTTPGGEQITILQEDEFVTLLESEGRIEQDGITWVKVRSFLGDEGWVAIDFLEIEGR